MKCDFLLVLGTLLGMSLAQKCELTGLGGPKERVPCVFPFAFGGDVYTECTSVKDPDGRPWCSTKVDENGKHVGGGQGNWGYCSIDCRLQDTGLILKFPNSPNSIARPRTTTRRTTTRRPTPRPRRTTTRRTTPRPTFTTRTTTRRPTRRPTRTTRTTTRRSTLAVRPPPPPPSSGRSEDKFSGTWLPDPDALEAECGFSTSQKFIFGGTQAKRGEFPFLALLGYRLKRDPSKFVYLCAATLINRRYVLTAAHCTDEDDSVRGIDQVILNEFDVGFDPDPDCVGSPCSPAQRIPVDAVTPHPTWDSGNPLSGADVALVRMARTAVTIFEDFDLNVVPVCLPWKRSLNLNPDHQVTAVGWGKTTNVENEDELSSLGIHERTPQKVSLPVKTYNDCVWTYGPELNRDAVCAGGVRGKDSCSGDSGGPLLSFPSTSSPSSVMFLSGIVSFGTKRCATGFPAVYTDVEAHMEWIRQNLRD